MVADEMVQWIMVRATESNNLKIQVGLGRHLSG